MSINLAKNVRKIFVILDFVFLQIKAASVFLKTKDSKGVKHFNVDVLEKRLKKAKRDKPWTTKLFNQIGNFWRIKGDAGKAIDCFRSALIMDPSNADVLHDLGRILFSLQYLDDAIFLVRRSLESQPSGMNAWRAYFTLGEIFRACGQFQQSILYFRQALDLYPDHEPILEAIQDMEDTTQSNVQFYTMLIIIMLVRIRKTNENNKNCLNMYLQQFILYPQVVSVICVILSTNDFASCADPVEQKPQRHFNRAMAMKSLKGFTSRSIKSRRN